jgi:hypothetical protein
MNGDLDDLACALPTVKTTAPAQTASTKHVVRFIEMIPFFVR